MQNKPRSTYNRILLAPPESVGTKLDRAQTKTNPLFKENSVIVLDDDDYFRSLVSSLLVGHGYVVHEARNAEQATELLETHNPSAAIVDYRLPGMDGISWITTVRERGNDMPIIFVSGVWCDKRTFEWLRNILKVSLIIKKPIEPELFLSSIEAIVPPCNGTAIADLSGQEPQVDLEDLLSRPNLEDSLREIDKLLEIETLSEKVRAELSKARRVVMTHRAVGIAKKSYIADLPAAWTSLTELLSQLSSNEGNKMLLSEAISISHKIKGTSGSYGLNTVSEKASEIESMLSAIADQQDDKGAIDWELIVNVAREGQLLIRDSLHSEKSTTSAKERGMSVLLISPDDAFSEQFRKYSQAFGLAIDHVATAREAVALCKLKSFDVAVIDLYGHASPSYLHLAKRLRSIPKCSFLPLGIVLQEGIDVDDSELIYQGFSAVISNPITQDGLDSVLEKLEYDSALHRPRVLCIDDDPIFTTYVRSILEAEGYTMIALNEPICTADVMHQFQPDLVLLDLVMPGLSGYDICRMIRSQQEFSNTKVIVLTIKGDAESRTGAFRAGASDFLVKPIVAPELVARVNAQLATAHRCNEGGAKILEQCSFSVRASTMIEDCRREGVKLSLVIVKFDNPAKIDAIHGDFSSDDISDAVRKVLSTRLRPCDLRGRWSDHEYVIVLPGVDKRAAEKVSHHLRWEISQYQFPSELGNSFCIETWGVAVECDDLDLPLEEVIEETLSAMERQC